MNNEAFHDLIVLAYNKISYPFNALKNNSHGKIITDNDVFKVLENAVTIWEEIGEPARKILRPKLDQRYHNSVIISSSILDKYMDIKNAMKLLTEK